MTTDEPKMDELTWINAEETFFVSDHILVKKSPPRNRITLKQILLKHLIVRKKSSSKFHIFFVFMMKKLDGMKRMKKKRIVAEAGECES